MIQRGKDMPIFTKTAKAVLILSRSLPVAAGLALAVPAVLAEPAPPSAQTAPAGQVMLTVTGRIAGSDGPGVARFDAAMLAALPRRSFATSTIWTEGVQSFSGVELRSLIDHLGVTGGTLKITAVNDYSVQIPVSEVVAGGALLADLRDGKPMKVRDKGPLWLVYPYDSAPEFRNEIVYSRSVWQVDRIEVLP
ncbi:oxidoreductase [Rhodobacter capsulatus R121]|jgi:hypothetical protein|nr:oxidoreductase [Rhodobacter capsulatus DE442]ETD77016.1 oxidoreductase [Rhodobacter capsulatus R121]ETE53974.1 oxidoreductase [Rhodobacter capsulatus Y262]